MARIAVIGDGPGGLSAALFLARAGHETMVYGTNTTAMHYAHLNNYLGSPDTGGSAFQKTALGQVAGAGATVVHARVTALAAGDPHRLTLENGTATEADYVILSEGKNPEVAVAAGVALVAGGGIAVDGEQRTSIDRVYAVGRATRPTRSQAIISAGDGAVAALDILAREAGGDVQDWDKADG